DDVARLGEVGDVVQHRDEHDGNRLAEVQGSRRLLKDLPGIAQVRVEVRGGALRGAGQQSAGVREHQRVVVHVDDPAARRGGLCDLVGVARGRQPGADVEELTDALGSRQVAHRPGQERPVGLGGQPDAGIDADCGVPGAPVGREVVLAAQPVVVDARDVRHVDVETTVYLGVLGRSAAYGLV